MEQNININVIGLSVAMNLLHGSVLIQGGRRSLLTIRAEYRHKSYAPSAKTFYQHGVGNEKEKTKMD